MFNGYDFIDELAEAAWGCDGHYPSSFSYGYINYEESINIFDFKIKYVNLFKPRAYLEGQEEKYSCMILIPKSDLATKKYIDRTIKECIEKAKNSFKFRSTDSIKKPIYDGDGLKPNGKPFPDDCKGHWVFTVYNKKNKKPKIPCEMKEKIKEGATVKRALFTFYPYKHGDKCGIAVSLHSIY